MCLVVDSTSQHLRYITGRLNGDGVRRIQRLRPRDCEYRAARTAGTCFSVTAKRVSLMCAREAPSSLMYSMSPYYARDHCCSSARMVWQSPRDLKTGPRPRSRRPARPAGDNAERYRAYQHPLAAKPGPVQQSGEGVAAIESSASRDHHPHSQGVRSMQAALSNRHSSSATRLIPAARRRLWRCSHAH
jgi:hypothetical protein